jgi:hypothetical protein
MSRPAKATYPTSRGRAFKCLVLQAVWFMAFLIIWSLAWIGLFISAILMPDGMVKLMSRCGIESEWSKHYNRRALDLLTVPRDALARDEQAAKDQPGLSPQARN